MTEEMKKRLKEMILVAPWTTLDLSGKGEKREREKEREGNKEINS